MHKEHTGPRATGNLKAPKTATPLTQNKVRVLAREAQFTPGLPSESFERSK